MHKKTLERVVRLREELDLPIATMLDTKGPEIRLGSFKNGKVLLKKGTAFTLRASQGFAGADAIRRRIPKSGAPIPSFFVGDCPEMQALYSLSCCSDGVTCIMFSE